MADTVGASRDAQELTMATVRAKAAQGDPSCGDVTPPLTLCAQEEAGGDGRCGEEEAPMASSAVALASPA